MDRMQQYKEFVMGYEKLNMKPMYRDVLPKMEHLLEEVGDAGDLPWGKCLDIRLYDRLVFEDLGASGYKMANRKLQLGLDASLLYMRALGKFHAASRVLLDRSELPLDIFGKHLWLKTDDLMRKMTVENVRRFIVQMESWGEEWKEAIERFSKALNTFGDQFLDAITAMSTSSEFSVLNHGDSWTNNLLWKYDDNPDQPSSIKFVDMQLCFVGFPAYDLQYFLLSSVRQSVRDEHHDELLGTYLESLKSTLAKFKYEGPVPDMDALKDWMTKNMIFLVINGIMMAPIITGHTENAPDLEEVMRTEVAAIEKGEASPETWDVYGMMSDVGKDILVYAAKQAMKHNIV